VRRQARVGISIAVAVIVALAGTLAWLVAARRTPPPPGLAHDTSKPRERTSSGTSTQAAGCPSGSPTDARVATVWARLARAPEGARLLGRLGERRPAMCFVRAESGLMQETLLLDERLDDDAAAARAGHLLSHLLEKDALDPESATDCDAFGRAALEAEERAHRIEATLLAELGRPEARRDPSVAARAVVEAYLERCRSARGSRQ